MTEIKNNNNSENPTGQKSESMATFDLEMPTATRPENRCDDRTSTGGIGVASGDCDSRQKQVRST